MKIFKGDIDASRIKFELALLTGLQKKSRHIMELVGYTDLPEFSLVIKFYRNGTLQGKIRDPSFNYDTNFVHKAALGIANGMVL